MDYRQSHLGLEKGESYHEAFTKCAYRRTVWEFERRVLDRILTECYSAGAVDHLDFACGTGRILQHLSNRVSTSVGVDVSPSMLAVARQNNPHSEIIEVDLTREDRLRGRAFNLITAFRFFPNAQPELRHEAMYAIVRHLRDDGYVVFNNHKNAGSLRRRIARCVGRQGGAAMSIAEVRSLVSKHGLRISKVLPVTILAMPEAYRLIPVSIVRPVDHALSQLNALWQLAENVIFVCRRS